MSANKPAGKFHFNGHGAGDHSDADEQVLEAMRFLDDVEDEQNFRKNARILTDALDAMSDVAQVSVSGKR